jgi:uncharacterized protein (DUF849 family)
MKPIIIEVGLNEAVGREQHPLVPSTPDEIAADILDCAAAGASIVHFHARDPDTGEQRFDATELYREAMSAVRSTGCDVHMYPTYPPFLSSGPDPAADRFHHVLELADDPAIGLRVAPLDMGSLNLAMSAEGKLLKSATTTPLEYTVYANPVPILDRMLREYDARDLVTALAVFEPGHLRTAMALLDSGLGKRAMLKFFLSGTWLHGPLPDRAGLEGYVRILDQLRGRREIEWICAPSGLSSPADVEALVQAAAELGGHVRVGAGDNPAAAGGRSNRELVEQVVRLASACGRRPATPRELVERFAPAA